MIREEYERLMEVFKDLPPDKLTVVDGLISQAAFMRVTLNRLQDTIKGAELTEAYQNGETQSGFKQSAELQAYNALVKNYSTIIRQLVQHIPKTADRPASNQLLALLEAKRKASVI